MTQTVSQASIFQQRMDRWVNEKNKFGTASDSMVGTSFYREARLHRNTLESLFVNDWLARRVISIMANDATRNWISLTSGNDNKDAIKVEKELNRLNVKAKIAESIKLSRLHGGSLFIMGAFDGQETDMPLRKVRSVEFVESVDRWQTFPQRYYADENSMNYGQPETYLIHRVQVRGTFTAVVHESRVIRFDGAYLPPLERMRNLGWHDSVLQNFYEELKRFGVTHQAVGSIVEDFITKKVQVKGLSDLLSNTEGEQQLMARFAMLAYGMSVHGLAVFGEDEQFEKMGTPLTGIDKIMVHFVDIVSAACEIPKARLFHNQSGVLGGDAGGNDLRVHYDNVSAYQENDLRPNLQRIIDVVAESVGVNPEAIEFTFKPLWQLSELDEAKARKEISEADINYINAGVVEPEEVALSRFGGDAINLADMIIDKEKRIRFLEALGKQKIDLNEGEDDDEESEEAKLKPAKEEIKEDMMPNKSEGESEDDFIARFMTSPEMRKEYPDRKQRLAVAHAQWKKQ